MIKEMTEIATECFKHPGHKSVWSPKLKKYVCPDFEDTAEASVAAAPPQETAKYPPINREFKLVFVTAAAGTLIFVVICLTMTLLAGREPHPLFEKVIMGFFDLAKIGFGAVVGLLGGKTLQAESDRKSITSQANK